MSEKVQQLQADLDELKKAVQGQAQELAEIKDSLKKLQTKMLMPTLAAAPIDEDELESLKLLLNSPRWPAAVDPGLICDVSSDQEKEERAEGILDLIIDVHLENLKFLDFGCGEGHVVDKSRSHRPQKTVGYDTGSYNWDRWASAENVLFTNDWEAVKASGPYNIVLVYDVLDHIAGEVTEVIEALRRIRQVLAPNGRVFVRCHPWCARHGTNQYSDLNKAYFHIVFTEEELASMGLAPKMFTREVIHPIVTYQEWFRLSGFNTMRNGRIIKEPVEPFFMETPLVAQRIKNRWKNSHERNLRSGEKFPTQQLEQQFVDYVLT